MNKQTGEYFAVKTINKLNADADKQLELEIEIEILSHIDHPNIVKIYEIYD